MLAAVTVVTASLPVHTEELLRRVTRMGPDAYVRMVASMPSVGTMWVEVPRADGSRYGLLRADDSDGSIAVRHVEGAAEGGPPRCVPVSVQKLGDSASVSVDWDAIAAGNVDGGREVRDTWNEWARMNLAVEVMMPGVDAVEALEAIGPMGMEDPVMLALALSPLVFPDVPFAWPGHDGTAH